MRIELAELGVAEQVEMYVVAGESPLATNRFDAPDAVRIEQRQARADELILPPHSFAMLVLQVL